MTNAFFVLIICKKSGVLSLDISGDVDDIWGNGGSSSIFGGGASGPNLADLEGTEL